MNTLWIILICAFLLGWSMAWFLCKRVMVVRYCRDEVWRQPPFTLLLQQGVYYTVVTGPGEPELRIIVTKHNQLSKLYRRSKP